MPDARVNGLRVHYERAGEGPPLVLLHGIGSNRQAWRHQLEDLSKDFTVVAWDMRGYGKSEDPPGPYSLGDVADDLAGLLDHLGVARAHVCGLSLGGVVALEFYGRHPGRVRSLVLADTLSGYGALPEEERRARLERRLAGAADPDGLARSRAPALLSPGASAELVHTVEAIMAEIHPDGYRHAARALAGSDARPMLPTIAVPTLILWGEHDTVCPRQEAEALLHAIPGARLAVIPWAGHVSNQENPTEFNRLVREFLRSVPR